MHNQALVQGKEHKVCVALQVVRLHDLAFVKFHGLLAQV